MSDVRRLDGKVAIVSGAARGQGAAIAELFAANGAAVLLGDLRDDEGEKLADAIGPVAHYVHLDVTSEDDWSSAVRCCLERFGGIDVLVNNAGILLRGSVASMTLADYRKVIDVNQIGCFLGMHAVVPAMRVRGGGSIVNTSSVAGLHGVSGFIAYSASKFAIRGMTRSGAIELGPLGIRVNSIHPGTVDTPMVNAPELADVDREAHFASVPAGRIGRPDEVATMALYLASDESSYCTGGEFVVDGGASCGSRR